DGSLDASFAANVSGALASVFGQSDGRVLLSLFPNTSPAQNAAFMRLSPFGATESDFTLDLTSANALTFAPVAAVLALSDGSLVVGGNFNAVGGVPRANLARLAADVPGRLTNLSALAFVPAGGDLTVGFGVRGAAAKSVLLRGVGPALGAYGVGDPLADPRLEVIPEGALAAAFANDNWNGAALAAAFGPVGAFPLVPGSKDAALIATVGSGAMTARVTSAVAGGSGSALAEIYDADASDAGSRLVNISALGFAGTGSRALIAGFAVDGAAAKRLLIRAVGPGLASFGVTDALADPRLAVIPQGTTVEIAASDDWSGEAEIVGATVAAGAFELAAGSKDAALVVRLPPGNYTVMVSGVGGTSGRALVEVYELDR
ncbi:MAG: delta-60 repeat domain-containing protein, partial [Opitutaceae bacterium]